MACPELEDLLDGKSGDHALHCENCRALLDAFAEIDTTFESAFAGISAPAGMAAAVHARISQIRPQPRISPVPEILDLIGWAAVLAMAAIVLPQFASFLSSILPGLGQ
jgi:hypothetical protein